MNDKRRIWRRVTALLFLRTPLLSFGELVLRPVTIAERGALDRLPHATGQNKK
jgi:hypothetical protein